MLRPIPAFVPNKLNVIDRLIIKLGDGQQSSLCILQEQLPQIFRITAIECTLLPDSTYELNANDLPPITLPVFIEKSPFKNHVVCLSLCA